MAPTDPLRVAAGRLDVALKTLALSRTICERCGVVTQWMGASDRLLVVMRPLLREDQSASTARALALVFDFLADELQTMARAIRKQRPTTPGFF